MTVRLGCIWLLLLLVFSCAVPVPPSGGPEDKIPPRIVSTVPADGSTGVDITSSIILRFSEKMSKAKLERLVVAYPRIRVGKVKWKNNSLRIEPADPLVPDTTYFIAVRPDFRDEHKVRAASGYEFGFSTGAAVDSGVIAGTVNFRRKPTASAVVRCFVLAKDSALVPEASIPNRETHTDKKGSFRFQYLPAAGTEYLLWAFQDGNKNSHFESGSEFGAAYEDTIVLTRKAPRVRNVTINISDPTEPGEIRGVVINETGLDSVLISVALFAGRDSTERARYYAFCDKGGKYKLSEIKKGSYMLRAFVDFKRDSICGYYPCPDDSTQSCTEPCVEAPDSVRMDPGAKLKLDPLILGPGKVSK